MSEIESELNDELITKLRGKLFGRITTSFNNQMSVGLQTDLIRYVHRQLQLCLYFQLHDFIELGFIDE